MADVLDTIAAGTPAPNIAGAMGNAITGSLNLQRNQFSLQQAMLAPAYSSMGALVAKGGAVTADDLTSSLANAHRVGANTDGLQAEMAERLAKGEQPVDIARDMWLRGQSPVEQQRIVLPEQGTENIGGQNVYGTRAPAAAPLSQVGPFTPAGGAPVTVLGRTPSPEQAMGKVTWVGSDGVEQQGTMQQYWAAQGADPGARIVYTPQPAAGGRGGGPAGGPAPSGSPAPTSGHYGGGVYPTAPGLRRPGADTSGGGGATGATGPAAAPGTGQPIPGPDPTFTANLKANQDAYNEDKGSAAGMINALNIGRDAYRALQLVGGSGPTSSWWNHVKTLAGVYGINIGDGTDYQLAKKNLLQWAQTNALNSIHSDLGLGTQMASNPNVDEMTLSAAKDALIEGMGRMRQRLAMIQEAPAPGRDHLNFRNQYLQDTDPRGFVLNMYDPVRRAAIANSVANDPVQRDRLVRARIAAKKYSLDPVDAAPVAP